MATKKKKKFVVMKSAASSTRYILAVSNRSKSQTAPTRLKLRKYDKETRRHELFEETKK